MDDFITALQAKLPAANVRMRRTTAEQKQNYLAIAATLHRTERHGQTWSDRAKGTSRRIV